MIFYFKSFKGLEATNVYSANQAICFVLGIVRNMSHRLRVRQAQRREEDLRWCTRSSDIASGLTPHSRLHKFQLLRIHVLLDAPGRLQVHGSTTDEQPTKELDVSQPEIIVIEDSPPEEALYESDSWN